MGSQFSSMSFSSNLSIPQNCKLYTVMPISSPTQQQQMTQILQKRMKLSQCPYLCTVKGYDFISQDTGRLTCSQEKKLVVCYDQYDCRLIQIPINNYRKQFDENQLCGLIKCIASALVFLRNHNIHHGDISLDNICRKGRVWKLIDKIFIKNGINAYEKVLEGQSGFISPKQMVRIRYGFVKQSPELVEADDIFSLGMVILQLASQIPSSLCYKETNVRFNEDVFNQSLYFCNQRFSKQFYNLLCSMLNNEEDERIILNDILNHPIIHNRSISNSNSNNISLSKIKASQLSQSANNSRSFTNINTQKFIEGSRKPLTPNIPVNSYNAVYSTQTTKQPSPAISYTSRNINSLKSSEYFQVQPQHQPQNQHQYQHQHQRPPVNKQAYQSYFGKPHSDSRMYNYAVGHIQVQVAHQDKNGNVVYPDKRAGSFMDSSQRLKTIN